MMYFNDNIPSLSNSLIIYRFFFMYSVFIWYVYCFFICYLTSVSFVIIDFFLEHNKHKILLRKTKNTKFIPVVSQWWCFFVEISYANPSILLILLLLKYNNKDS